MDDRHLSILPDPVPGKCNAILPDGKHRCNRSIMKGYFRCSRHKEEVLETDLPVDIRDNIYGRAILPGEHELFNSIQTGTIEFELKMLKLLLVREYSAYAKLFEFIADDTVNADDLLSFLNKGDPTGKIRKLSKLIMDMELRKKEVEKDRKPSEGNHLHLHFDNLERKDAEQLRHLLKLATAS
jgi:hypothetical protein